MVFFKILKDSKRVWKIEELTKELNQNWKNKLWKPRKKESFNVYHKSIVQLALNDLIKKDLIIEKDKMFQIIDKSFQYNFIENKIRLEDGIEQIMNKIPGHWWTKIEILYHLNQNYQNKCIPDNKKKLEKVYEIYTLSDIEESLNFKKIEKRFIVNFIFLFTFSVKIINGG